MRLWTIQHASVLDGLKRDGVLRADGRNIDRGRRRAYEWMVEQLTKKIGPPPNGCHWPIWGWEHLPSAHYRGLDRARPDLRARGHLLAGTRGVRIAFEADEDKVLLSCFDSWHAVLNDHYNAVTDREFEVSEAFIAEKGADAREVVEQRQRSWERIFDLDLIPDKTSYAVQAVLWKIPANRSYPPNYLPLAERERSDQMQKYADGKMIANGGHRRRLLLR